MRERAYTKGSRVEIIRDEVCTKFARPRNPSWMNARTGAANTGCTKVGIVGIQPAHKEINVKVRNSKVRGFQSETSESSNKCFYRAP
jgi:hypothetical protein